MLRRHPLCCGGLAREQSSGCYPPGLRTGQLISDLCPCPSEELQGGGESLQISRRRVGGATVHVAGGFSWAHGCAFLGLGGMSGACIYLGKAIHENLGEAIIDLLSSLNKVADGIALFQCFSDHCLTSWTHIAKTAKYVLVVIQFANRPLNPCLRTQRLKDQLMRRRWQPWRR